MRTTLCKGGLKIGWKYAVGKSKVLEQVVFVDELMDIRFTFFYSQQKLMRKMNFEKILVEGF